MAHRNSWFPYYKWLFSKSQTVNVYRRVFRRCWWNPSWFLQIFPAAKGSSSTPRAALFSSACLRPQGALAGANTTYGIKLFFKVGGSLAKTHVSWNQWQVNFVLFPYYITILTMWDPWDIDLFQGAWWLAHDLVWNLGSDALCAKVVGWTTWGGWPLDLGKSHDLYLVGGFSPSEKYESQLGVWFPIYGKIKHVPNHQPVHTHTYIYTYI